MNGDTTLDQSAEIILKRLDIAIRELQSLRATLLAMQVKPPRNLTRKLYGVLGRGVWDEYDFDHIPHIQCYSLLEP